MRVGNINSKDIEMLQSRVRPKHHPDLENLDLVIVPTRKACARYNREYMDSLIGEELILKAKHFHPTQKKYKPFIEKKEGAIGTTSFLDEIHLKVGAKMILIHNIDTSDGLTNGQLGTLTSILYTVDGQPDKLILNLQKKDAGVKNRQKYPNIAKRFPDSVIIEKVSINYSLRKKGGSVGATATLVQFPLKVAHAITAHKIQGQTIPKPLRVAFDLKNIFEEAQGYVMLSRVQELDQVFILDELDPSKLCPSNRALKEYERMNRVSINENPSPWNDVRNNAIKIVFMNCAGLPAHFKDIQNDRRLEVADMIQLLETSLTNQNKDEDYSLPGLSSDFISIGNGKGIASFYNRQLFTVNDKIGSQMFQLISFKNRDIDVICVYRSQIGNSALIVNNVRRLIDSKRITLVIGDFNTCFRENFNNPITQGLTNLGFVQLVKEPTHIRGRIIDHAYIKDPTGRLKPIIERYSPYYTDHDAICITITYQSLQDKQIKVEE